MSLIILSNPGSVEADIGQTSTLFPIVFSFVIGQMLSQAARWRLENGTQLGYLEQLMGSRTVFSAFSTHFSLRTLNILSVALISLWLLSPFGAQSALRLLDLTYRESLMKTESTYFDSTGEPMFSSWDGSSDSNRSRLSSMYLASLFSADGQKTGPGDIWKNVKIPYLPYNLSETDVEWVDVSLDGSTQYSALVGIPAVRLGKPMYNKSFTWESTYVDLRCNNISTSDDRMEVDLDLTRMGSGLHSNNTYGVQSLVSNGTFSTAYNSMSMRPGPWILALDTFVDRIWYPDSNISVDWSRINTRKGYFTPSIFVNEAAIESRQATLLFQGFSPNVTTAYCKVSQVYVESNITCVEQKYCAVVAQRKSIKPQANSNITQLSWPQTMKQVVNLPTTLLSTNSDGLSDPSLHYIAGENITGITVPKEYARIDKVSPEMFSRRLGQLINTYLMLGNAYTAILAPSAGSHGAFRYNLTATVTGSTLTAVYSVSKVWLCIYVVSALALTSAAFANPIINHFTLTPKVLGTVSLAIRDSRYISIPPGTGILDGMELSREVRRMEIRYGVVKKTDDGFGVLGITTRERAGKVENSALYI